MLSRLRLQPAARIYAGSAVAIILAVAAFALAEQYAAPVMLFAILLGMAMSFLGEDERCAPGLDFCAKTVLRIGVALLGLRVTVDHLMALGWSAVAIVALAVVLTIVLGALLGRLFGLGSQFGVLTGGSVAICGASAAIALSSVLPSRQDGDQRLVFVIIGVTALSTLSMIVYPPIANSLGLGDVAAGVFLGGTIHDVAQVVGAGYSVSPATGDLATIVKLLRVAMLVPTVFLVMLIFHTSGGQDNARFPFFLVAFVVLAAANSFGLVPAWLVTLGNTVSRWCLVVAIAAVGAKTALREVAQMGWPPVLMMLAETAFIAVFVLAAYLLWEPGPTLLAPAS